MLTYRRPSALRLFALVFALVTGLAVVFGAMLSDAHAQAGGGYTFTKVADSVEDGFDPFSFGCAAINAPGDVAFRAGRLAPDGFNTIPGIYRANADGTLTTIAEDPKRFVTIGFNPSINDSGQVSFAASLDGGNKSDTEAILRGDGRKLTTIASTTDEFDSFGFDTSINNSGEVAFTAERDEEFGFDEGLFSGSGGKKSGVTTHYLASTSDFDGSDSRPSINNLGDIAFVESIEFDRGIFVGKERDFTPIVTSDPSVGVPNLNDAGTVAFTRSFTDEDDPGDRDDRRRRYAHGGRRHDGRFRLLWVQASVDQQRRRRGLPCHPRRWNQRDLRGLRSGDRHGRYAGRLDGSEPHLLRGGPYRLRPAGVRGDVGGPQHA